MKSLDQLRKILNELELGEARKADLINKYKKADSSLRNEMQEYFGIKATEEEAPNIKHTENNNYNKPDSKAYYGSNARNFDHRARPTPDLHLESDKALDNEYFKNSK